MMFGRCFESAGKALLMPPDINFVTGWKLAHGVVTGTKGIVKVRKYSHAWIENDTLVYDGETRSLYLKDTFYEAGNVCDVCRYDKREALEAMLDSGHYGPWNPRFYKSDLMG